MANLWPTRWPALTLILPSPVSTRHTSLPGRFNAKRPCWVVRWSADGSGASSSSEALERGQGLRDSRPIFMHSYDAGGELQSRHPLELSALDVVATLSHSAPSTEC